MPKVCIIGGGVSGLKTAEHLLSNGFLPEDVLIIEAQDRLGGRILTDRTSSVLEKHYDLGASWFHDSLTNCVLKELLEDPHFDFSRDALFNDEDPIVVDKDGVIDMVKLKINRVVEDIEAYIEIKFFDLLTVKDISLKEVVDDFVKEHSKMLTDEQKVHATKFMRYLELWFGIPWEIISGKYAVMSHQGRNVFNKRGYDYLVEKLVQKIPKKLIITGKQVCRIDRREKGRIDITNSLTPSIIVETTDGMKISSEYIVMTVPQSILLLPANHDYGIEWLPPLPSNVQDAIHSVHFSALGKVIFEFDEVWWKNNDTFLILSDETSHGKVSSQLNGNFAQKDENPLKLSKLPPSFSYPAYILNLADASNGSLCILTQSPLTDYLEAHPDEAWTYFKPMLAKIAASHVKDPIHTITSKWTTNPYIRGSYTALHTGDDALDLIVQLSGEIEGCGLSHSTIRFAGEHTILDGTGCVHGAYASGLREAEWILERNKEDGKR